MKRWYGRIVDISDPSKNGRARIRIFGKFNNVPDNEIPWAMRKHNASFSSSGGSGEFSAPKLDSIVSVYFDGDDPYTPIYEYIPLINSKLLEKISGDYEGSHSLLYDVDENDLGLKIYLLPTTEGLMIDFKKSIINIKPDGAINIETENKINIISNDTVNVECNTINLGESAAHALLKGDVFQNLYNSHTHIGDLGYPTGPPIIPSPPTDLSEVTKTK